jgi:phosphopantetheine adenylyltransferase
MEEKMNIAVFAGSFDPLTIGHYDIALRESLKR